MSDIWSAIKQVFVSNYISDDRHPVEVANQLGLVPLESHSRLLMLDLDTPEQEATFNRNFDMFVHNVPGVAGPYKTRSKSGHTHAYIKIPPLPLMDRLALQAALGSDPMRELLGVLRAKGHRRDRAPKSPIWLFETPDQAAKIQRELGVGLGYVEPLWLRLFYNMVIFLAVVAIVAILFGARG